MDDGYLTREEVAERYHTTVDSVRYWAYKSYGPRFVRVGKKALYPFDEIERFDKELRAQQIDGAAA